MESYYTFLQKHNHRSKGLLYIYIYCIYIYIYVCMKSSLNTRTLKQCHTLSQGLLCVLKATFSNECHTRVESYLRKTINIFRKYHIGNCVVLISCYIVPNECGSFFEGRMPNTIVQANTFHEIIKYFVKGMPHSWKTRRRLARERKRCVSSSSEYGSRKR